MKETISRPVSIIFTFLVVMAFATAASAQQASAAKDITYSGTVNKAASSDGDPAARFYALTEMAPAQLKAGELEKAKATALELLSQAPEWKSNWNYGNAVHIGNLVLGHIAMASDDVEQAKAFLLKAGGTPGSPQLNSFGPNMLLAKELLTKGEQETVFEYFDLCEKFWISKFSSPRLADWKAAVKRGETPEFGANLLYGF